MSMSVDDIYELAKDISDKQKQLNYYIIFIEDKRYLYTSINKIYNNAIINKKDLKEL